MTNTDQECLTSRRSIRDALKKCLHFFVYCYWLLNGYWGRRVSVNIPCKATVIIPSFHKRRASNLSPLARSILKCDFVEQLVISNHNPQLFLEDVITFSDKRMKLINQPRKCGCGYGWIVASKTNAEFIISVDDDVLIFPMQLAKLFRKLVEYPEVPHGLAGGCGSRYYRSRELEVEQLYEIYAVTKQHIDVYFQLFKRIISFNLASAEDIQFWSDDILISHAGTARPRIHDVGFILRCLTAREVGIATHMEDQFYERRVRVARAVEAVKQSLRMQHHCQK